MINSAFNFTKGDKPSFLFLGAHADDIEIGCGATVLQLADSHPNAEYHWIVFSARGVRESEASASAKRFLSKATKKEIQLEQFRDGFFPQNSAAIKELFEAIKMKIAPSVIFTHFRNDLHQDHRVINELTWNTFRNHLVLEYEIPKYDGDLGSPSVFVPATDEYLVQKWQILRDEYASQRDKQWFSESTFRAIARLRGIECNSPCGHAEAFYCRKLLLEL